MMSMTRVEAIPHGLDAGRHAVELGDLPPNSWTAVEAAPKAVNILPYVPVAPLLIWVMGFEAAKAGKRPTPEQHAELTRLMHEAMDAGACGWSAQRMLPTGPKAVQRTTMTDRPMPTDVMHDETCREFAWVLGRAQRRLRADAAGVG